MNEDYLFLYGYLAKSNTVCDEVYKKPILCIYINIY